MVCIGEAPAGFAKPAEQVRPDRLKNVGRIKPGAERGREMPADRLAEVRLVGQKDLLRGRHITLAQLGKELIQGLVHDLSPEETIRRKATDLVTFPGRCNRWPP